MNCNKQEWRTVLMLLPSLRISGGVKEAIRLAVDLEERAVRIHIVVLWRNKHELPCFGIPVTYLSDFIAKRSTAALQYPLLVLRFIVFIRNRFPVDGRKGAVLLLTHFSTFAFAWVSPWIDRYCFSQDVEWMFVRAGWRRSLLRRFILATCRRSRIITTNSFVESLYNQEGIRSTGRLSIWAHMDWLTNDKDLLRDVDVVMLVRRGHMKRMDLYLEVLRLIKQGGLSSLVITPDSEIYADVSNREILCVLRPGDDEIRDIYRRSKVFLLLSDTEGFALPPLEAMGSGCVPLCRDSGGPQCYMTGPLAKNLVPLRATSMEVYARIEAALSNPEALSKLSEYARRSFIDGFQASSRERDSCLTTLSKTLLSER